MSRSYMSRSYMSQKSNFLEALGVPSVCPVSSLMKPTRDQGFAPTLGELRIPSDHFETRTIKNFYLFSTTLFRYFLMKQQTKSRLSSGQ